MVGLADQAQPTHQAKLLETETLRVMGKGVDRIYVGEQSLYVLPGITKITNRYGTTISLSRLRTPCLAEVTYARWVKGVKKLPVIVDLKVQSVYRGASVKRAEE